jgi:DNA-binding beta-propeller fold protein YncE
VRRLWPLALVLTAVLAGPDSARAAARCDTTDPRTNPHYFAANLNGNSVTEYTEDAFGNATPATVINGPSTGLNRPHSLAHDTAGNLYVLNSGSNSVTKYARTATGDAAPIATIAGPHTGIANVLGGVAVDASGALFVATQFGTSVLQFAPGANGDAAPVATLAGPQTGLSEAVGLTLDAGGNLYAANYGNNTVTKYAKGAAGDAAPVAAIQGSNTGLDLPSDISITAGGGLLVANDGPFSVTEYAPGATGNAAPVRTIRGSHTGLEDNFGLDLVPGGDVAVSNARPNSITVFGKDATGDATPENTIAGSQTQLNQPYDVAFGPPTPPDAPTIDHVTAGFATVTVAYSPPDYSGGFPITSYTATAIDLTDPSGGGQTVSGPGAPLTINGLTNGHTYTFTLTAANAVGAGPASTQSAPLVLSPPTFVANSGGDSVAEFAFGATGNTLPLLTLSGSHTGLSAPIGVALDRATGHVFVANDGPGIGAVTEYADGAFGDAAPVRTIAGTHTGLNTPFAVAIDPATGHVFVSNSGPGLGSVTEYAAGATGDVTPVATIAGSHTGINVPFGLAVDPVTGKLIVANAGSDSVTVYANGANGDAAPIATIKGSHTGLDFPAGVAVDASGALLVANQVGNSVTTYANGASGDATPTATIQGAHTGFSAPAGLALDASGNLLVANVATDAVTEYRPGANGDATPTATIAGAATELDDPIGVATPGLPPSAPPRVSVVAKGLSAPKHLAFGPRGLHVVESGSGGAIACVTARGTSYRVGRSGAVSRITANGPVTVVRRLPSVIAGDTGEVAGPAGIAFRRGRMAIVYQDLLVRRNGTTLLPRPARGVFGTLRVGRKSVDLARFAARHPQTGLSVRGALRWDSDPYDVTAYRGGYAVVDAAANALLFVSRSGHVRLLARFPARAAKGGVRAEAVPTSVAVGPDKALYVGTLRGVPSRPRTAAVYRVVRGRAPRVWARGLTAVTAIAFDRRGRLLATELSTGGLLAPDTVPGALVRVSRDGKRVTDLRVPGLFDPTGVAVGGKGAVYVSNRGTSTAAGEVLRITAIAPDRLLRR